METQTWRHLETQTLRTHTWEDIFIHERKPYAAAADAAAAEYITRIIIILSQSN